MPRVPTLCVALTLALALAACGRPTGDIQPETGSRVETAATAGTLESRRTGFFASVPYVPGQLPALRSIAFQPDGKFVAAGATGTGNVLVTRYLADGRPDPSFGGGDGRVAVYFPGPDEAANAVRLQPDGKIVVAGYATKPDGKTQVAVARLNPDGSIDRSFDGDGVRVSSVGVASAANAVAVYTAAGQLKIVVAGYSGASSGVYDIYGERRFAAVRYNANGSLDTTFDGDGVALSEPFGYAIGNTARAVVVQPDGKIVLGGGAVYDYVRIAFDTFALVRLNPNGSRDSSFQSAAIRTDRQFQGIQSLALQPDGKIVAAGVLYGAFAVARYHTDGRVDGPVQRPTPEEWPGGGSEDAAIDVSLQLDGKIVAAGLVYPEDNSSGSRFALARLNPDLSLDSSFGTGGLVTTDSSGRNDAALRVSASGSRIVAAGGSASGASTSFVVDRYFK